MRTIGAVSSMMLSQPEKLLHNCILASEAIGIFQARRFMEKAVADISCFAHIFTDITKSSFRSCFFVPILKSRNQPATPMVYSRY